MMERTAHDWITKVADIVLSVRVIVTAFLAAAGAGAGMWAYGDAGGADHITQQEAPRLVDSLVGKALAPTIAQLDRQNTAIIQIQFSLDVMMTDAQKQRADSLMKAAVRRFNYGGSP